MQVEASPRGKCIYTTPYLPILNNLQKYRPSFYRGTLSVGLAGLGLLGVLDGPGVTKKRHVPFTISSNPTIYKKIIITMEYKRQYRDLPDEVKQKISASTKGRAKSYDHKQHISQGMKKYWSSVPSRDRNQKNNEVEPLTTDGSM